MVHMRDTKFNGVLNGWHPRLRWQRFCELCYLLVECLRHVKYIHFSVHIFLFLHKLSDFGMLSVSSSNFGLALSFFLHHICTCLISFFMILGTAQQNTPLLILSVEHHETHLEWRKGTVSHEKTSSRWGSLGLGIGEISRINQLILGSVDPHL